MGQDLDLSHFSVNLEEEVSSPNANVQIDLTCGRRIDHGILELTYQSDEMEPFQEPSTKKKIKDSNTKAFNKGN
jgi:hypothetical protein